MHAERMISTHPQARGSVNDALVRCIEACLDCAELCSTVARVGSRRTGGHEETLRRLIELCADLCRLCGEECRTHAHHHRHCEICADTCRECETACRSAAATLALPHQ